MKIAIEKLGKIDKASFDIKNLTIFVGKNSTNKSYVANSVYKLNKILSDFKIPIVIINTLSEKFLKEHKNFISDISNIERTIDRYEHVVEIDEKQVDKYIVRRVIFNLKNNDNLIKNLIDSSEKYLYKHILKEINKSFNSKKNNILRHIHIEHTKLTIEDSYKIEDWDNGIVNTTDDIQFLKNIFSDIVKKYTQEMLAKNEYYFPASRTGFVLALEEIASGLFKNSFGKEKTNTTLTEPTIDFISSFMDIKLDKFIENKYFIFDTNNNFIDKKILNFIENRLIKGKIIEDKEENEYLNFYLQPKDSEKIELHLTSSSAVELLPLVVFLKHFSKLDDKFLIIEEPEAHLHPQAQIEMARLIIMLVNAGAKVLITTHSDYILSEINNCIKLSNIKESKRDEYLKKYKLDESMVIDKDRVSAYLFKEKKDKVIVDELNIDEYGIANDNFDEVLDELLDRTQEINESF